MNALLIVYTLISATVLAAVMAMLLWGAVADGRAATDRQTKSHTASARLPRPREAIRPLIPLHAMPRTGAMR